MSSLSEAALETTTPALNVTSGFADSTGLATVVGIVVVIALVIFGLTISARFYRMVLNASGAFAQSFEYAIKGVATAVVIGVFIAPVYLFSTLDGETRTVVYQAVGALIAGYVGLVILGYAGDRVWTRIKRQHEQVTGHGPLANIGDTEGDAE